MKKTYFLRTIKVALAIMIMFTVFLIPSDIKAKKVIRVAYPLQDGLTMKDEDGNYYGYDYDYLMQIAQYTGWTYEFVEVEGDMNERLTKFLNMLEKGEIDLFGGLKYNAALQEKYDYPTEPYGSSYNVIAVNDSSDIYDLTTLIAKQDLRIGVLKAAVARIEKLDQYALMNGFTYEKVEYETTEEMLADCDKDKIDAVLSVDISKPASYNSVTRFSPDSFYFATTKGNTDIISDLNQALDNIRQINPTLSSTLYNRYFSGEHTDVHLSAVEKEFILSHPEIRVLANSGNAPVQYMTKEGNSGIGKDILDLISESTGLNFTYVNANNYDEYAGFIKQGAVDLLLGLPYEGSKADALGITLSDPYLSTTIQLVTKQGIDPNELSDKQKAVSSYSDQRYDNNPSTIAFDSPEAILKGIDDGKADYAYVNSYLYTFYMNKYHFSNLTAYSTADYLRSQYAFGVPKSDDFTLLSIINKGIRASQSEMQSFIYKNGNAEQEYSITAFIKNNFVFVGGFVLVVIFIIISGIWWYYRRQLKMKKEVELEYQRYLELSEISGEITFSYDYRQDELKISKYGIGRLTTVAVIPSFLNFSKDVTLSCSLQMIQELLKGKEDINEEIELELLDGVKKWYQVTIKVVLDKAKTGTIAIYAVGKVLDIQEDVAERQMLVEKSQTDTLTGLLNRAGAQEFIGNALAKENEVGALLMMDLDNFKDVNDTYGHLEGDHVLVETSTLLNQIFHNQPIARLGGDEFIIYCCSTTQEEVQKMCEDLLNSISEIPCMRRRNIKLTVSIGIAFTNDTKNYTELMRLADESLYYVKRNNRNNYHFYAND